MKVLLPFFLVLFYTASDAQTAKPILVQNQYYPKQGKDDEVYKWRLFASETRAKLGLPKGRILKKLTGTGGPYIIWECEYATAADREKDVVKVEQSEEFKRIQEHMVTILDKFERAVWEIDN